jgi:hypothetical protein
MKRLAEPLKNENNVIVKFVYCSNLTALFKKHIFGSLEQEFCCK